MDHTPSAITTLLSAQVSKMRKAAWYSGERKQALAVSKTIEFDHHLALAGGSLHRLIGAAAHQKLRAIFVEGLLLAAM